jgi:type VI secretion system protein ImpL
MARVLSFPALAVTGTVERETSSGLEMEWSSVFTEYRALRAQYPLNSRGNDAPLQDFSRFFAPGGSFWSFYDNTLAGSVTKDGVIIGPGVRVSSAFRQCLKQVNSITTAFFSEGPEASFTFSVRGASVRAEVSSVVARSVRFDLGGGEPLIWKIGQRKWHRFSWPGDRPMEGTGLQVDASGTSVRPKSQPGPWGFFRLLDEAQNQPGSGDANRAVSWRLETGSAGLRVTLDIGGLARKHPLIPGFFRCNCPSSITGGG